MWEENGKLKMLVGQGLNGDYYEDGAWVYGLYESEDMGKNWMYVSVEKATTTRFASALMLRKGYAAIAAAYPSFRLSVHMSGIRVNCQNDKQRNFDTV